VDGFRLDTINFLVHDQKLRDNPARALDEHLDVGVFANNPYAYQYHVYDKSRPENIAVLNRIRALMDRYPGSITVGEIGDDDSVSRACEYVQGQDRLHIAYTFNLLHDKFGADFIRTTVEELESQIKEGWPCWSFGNHDTPRALTRLAPHLKEGSPEQDQFAKLLMAILFSLRGTVIVYQGEELGLPEANVPFEKFQDPYGITFYPEYKGRDGCRTPIPWNQNQSNSGFSKEGSPWLPITQEHTRRAVDTQEDDSISVLGTYQRFLKWRKNHPALQHGDITLIDAPKDILAFVRGCEEEKMLIVFNTSEKDASFSLSNFPTMTPLEGTGFNTEIVDGYVKLPPFGAFFAKL
ncbi:MAG: alpha-glucosidase, partial [Alphaproteobacteria bacterium]|nr:alpha-glucosidase [Alphaproteobacteria bacterium]